MVSSRQTPKNPFLLHQTAAWAKFDAQFYAASNPAARQYDSTAALLDHYLTKGAAAGFSPNPWFDESFYRTRNPDVEELIRAGESASGFHHYCETGYPTRAPHWLFDPAFYATRNPQLTEGVLKNAGFANAYDHFLKYGDAERRLCHPFFDPATYLASLDPNAATECIATGPFKHFITTACRILPPAKAEPRVSPLFDPAWYLATYKQAEKEIRTGAKHSALHHYLSNETNSNFQPLPPASALQHKQPAPPRLKIHVDRPFHRNGEAIAPIEGHLDIIGWAAANHPVAAIDIYVDGAHCGRAHHGIRSEGVAAAFPELTHALFAGFRFISPSPPSPGRHRLRIVARGDTGLETSEEFDADFKQAALTEGPWCLRRRMRGSEAGLKTRLIDNAGKTPHFLIVLPHAADDAQGGARTIISLDRQIYKNWRLANAENGIAPQQDWLIKLSPGDELGVDALLELALHRTVHPEADFLYSDERRIDPGTFTLAPFFKPDWSPDLLLATDYVGRLWAASAALMVRAGLTPADLAACSNHDLVLRLTECAGSIGHVPLVLCESAPQAADPQGLQRALGRRGIDAAVEPGLAPATWRILPVLRTLPRISVIIPTAGTRGLIETVLGDLRHRTDYPQLEIIVLDTVPDTPGPWKACARALADRVIGHAAPFNWAAVNNLAATHATGEALLFLNDDIALPAQDADPAWLRTMVEQLACPGIGIVGPQLLYPGGVVQHAGMFLHGTGARNAFAGLAAAAPGPFGQALTQRNVCAVTGACLLVRRAVFDQLGGFDARFGIVCNDTDFCLRAQAAGWRVIYTPHASLIHHESATRTGRDEAADEALFADIWRHRLRAGDPYFSRYLSPDHTDYRPDPEYIETIYPARPLAHAGTIRRILVIKLDQPGDFLLSLPAIRHLAQFFSAARLDLVASPDVCRLAAAQSSVAGLIPFVRPAPGDGVAIDQAPDLAALVQGLQREAYDLAIDLRCHTETRPLLQASGATWRAGFDPGHAFPWLDIVATMEPDTAGAAKRTHMAETLLALAMKITTAFTPPTPVFADAGARPGWPRSVPPPPGMALRIAIHPGAGTAIKRWPAANFAALIDDLSATYACWIVLVGSAAEADLAETILAAVRGSPPVSAVGLTAIEDLPALLANCDLFIGTDSFPLHLAATLGVATIGIHAGVVDPREWSPQGSAAVSIRRRTYCSPCYLAEERECAREKTCLIKLTHRSVMDNVAMVIARK